MTQKTSIEALPELLGALGETAWMVGWSFLIVVLLGTAVGVLLRLWASDGLVPSRGLYAVVGAAVLLSRAVVRARTRGVPAAPGAVRVVVLGLLLVCSSVLLVVLAYWGVYQLGI